MIIGIPKETLADERRVAATPETVKKLVAMGHSVLVEKGAGDGSFISDEEFRAAGAAIASDAAEIFKKAEIALKVRGPEVKELSSMQSGAILVGLLSPNNKARIEEYNKKKLTCFALELLPRITRAQSMDVLSSQANIAGYKSVLMAADAYGRHFPMLMTAAGTIRPAKVLVLGAGVAGLMAIATAKRLGAVVEAFDVRPAVKEQVQSLGAKFVEVPLAEGESAETTGGYAKEMSDDYKKRQAELIQKHAANADIIITTAMIPGKPAPRLIQDETVKAMKLGSVIVDLAAETGGNCALTEFGKTVVKNGVTIIGTANLPSLVAADASSMYSRNIFNFLELLIKNEEKKAVINRDDEIIAGTLMCMGGEMLK